MTADGGGSDGGSGDDAPSVVRLGPDGDRRAERAISGSVDWLLTVDGPLLAGDADRGSIVGFDRDLERQFTVEGPTPRRRPPVVEDAGDDGGRVYLGLEGTIRAIDIDGETGDGKVAWERSEMPTRHTVVVDENGPYAVDFRSGDPIIVAIGADGERRWTAPLPEGVRVDALFVVDGRLIVVDDGRLYGLRAEPGERWSLL